MTEGHMATDDAVRGLVGWLASWTWPLEKAAVIELAAAYGWTLVSETGAGLRWETGLIGDGPTASAVVRKGVVDDLNVRTARVPEDDPSARRLIRDAFAGQVAVVADELGAPRRRKQGKFPEVEWDLPSGAALAVLAVERSCGWVLTSPKFVEIERDLARQGR